MFYQRIYKKSDHTLLLAVALIIVFGVVVIGSASVSYTDESFNQIIKLSLFMRLLHLNYSYMGKQLLWVVLGVLAMMAIMYIPYNDICRHSWTLYVVNLLMLGMVLFLGHSSLGAQRWIKLGPFNFQPSEFAKLLLIITLADFLNKRKGRLNRLRDLLPCFLYVGVPTLLVLKQPDMGTSMVFVAIMFGMLFFAGANPKLLLWLLGIGTVLLVSLFLTHAYLHNAKTNLGKELTALEQREKAAVTVAARQQAKVDCQRVAKQYQAAQHRMAAFYKFTLLKPYQVKRLTIFLNPQSDLLGGGYNIWQSLITIGSGGLLGKGLLRGVQTHLTFLPIRQTDFIFSVVGEEFGFIGALILIILFLIVLYRSIQIMSRTRDPLGILLAAGIISMFAFHVFVNIGMSSGIMPVTGIPLPLFSYGGSNMIMNLAALGLLMNVQMYNNQVIF